MSTSTGFFTPRNIVRLLVSLTLPILILGGILTMRNIGRTHGIEVVLPVQGYDPRSLLAGHYVQYQIRYGSRHECSPPRKAVMCLNIVLGDWKGRVLAEGQKPNNEICQAFIIGNCHYRQFTAGVEKFYIPEEHMYKIDNAISHGRAKIVLNINAHGHAAIKNMLIDDRNWDEYVLTVD